jgi:hypothetical protein
MMPLVGRDSLVAGNPHHEPDKSYLLGPHGSGEHQVVASAGRAAFGQAMELDLVHEADEPDISSKDHASENNIFPTSPVSSHRSLFIHQPRQSLSEQIIVSSTLLSFNAHTALASPAQKFDAIHNQN